LEVVGRVLLPQIAHAYAEEVQVLRSIADDAQAAFTRSDGVSPVYEPWVALRSQTERAFSLTAELLEQTGRALDQTGRDYTEADAANAATIEAAIAELWNERATDGLDMPPGPITLPPPDTGGEGP
jgi:hypothetical protein